MKMTETNGHSNAKSTREEIKTEYRYPVMEIWKELEGSMPIKGKSLYFRLFDDGAVEFDQQLRKENESGKPRYIYSIERTPLTKIPEAEFRELKSLLAELVEGEDVKKEYRGNGVTPA
jgi:hypothetical protein